MKVQVPREVIDDLVKKYGCTQEEATQAFLTAGEEASVTLNETLDRMLGDKSAERAAAEIKLFTPREIKEHLDRYVIGQEEYKKRICIAAAYHFAMLRHVRKNSDTPVKRFRKKNTIIAGPSGSGKTYCVEVLGDLLKVPTLIIDSTDYTEAGYVGKSADDMVRELIDMAPGQNRLEQAAFINDNGGIIFIDEIDKKAKEGGLVGHDISREGFQRSVLKLMERKLVSIDNPYSPAAQMEEAMKRQQGRQDRKQDKMISTENILFILGGSFQREGENLEKIVKKRLDHGELLEDGSIRIPGFDAGESSEDEKKLTNFYREAGADDYIRFGLLPELVGRAPIRTFVNLLSKNDLIRIMVDTEDSVLAQYRLEFEMFGIELDITTEAIEYVAETAQNKKTGARALVSVWENILTDFQMELPGSDFKKLEVSRELCERPRDVLLKMIEKSPFIAFVEEYRREYGIELELEEGLDDYIEEIAHRENRQVSETIISRLKGVSALNYMGFKGKFTITREMVDDPKYFDRLFTEWYQKNKATVD